MCIAFTGLPEENTSELAEHFPEDRKDFSTKWLYIWKSDQGTAVIKRKARILYLEPATIWH